ncbi:hypothetical protein JCM6882_008318 [Rhodosporidiobolus microsporus]
MASDAQVLAALTRLQRNIDEALALDAPVEQGQPVLVKTCKACSASKLDCQYPVQRKLGRKVKNPKTLKLHDIQNNAAQLAALLRGESPASASTSTPSAASSSQLPLAGPSASTSTATFGSDPPDDYDELLEQLADTLRPLALSGHRSASSTSRLPNSQTPPAPLEHVADAEPSIDPVVMGLLTEGDFERLLVLYNNNMQLYHYLLDPHLHTSFFLRRTSPFLSTVIALVAAQFCPHSTHLIPALQTHADFLSERVFRYNFKSVEIVLAYLAWVPWSSTSPSAQGDRSWMHVGEAPGSSAAWAVRTSTNPVFRRCWLPLISTKLSQSP